MSIPTIKQLKPNAAILSAPVTPGGPAVIAKLGDAIAHPSGAGWHICCCPLGMTATVPVGGLPLGQSTDQFHWSVGASFSGMGVPSSYSPANYDAAQTGYGSDGRINGGANGTPSFQEMNLYFVCVGYGVGAQPVYLACQPNDYGAQGIVQFSPGASVTAKTIVIGVGEALPGTLHQQWFTPANGWWVAMANTTLPSSQPIFGQSTDALHFSVLHNNL